VHCQRTGIQICNRKAEVKYEFCYLETVIVDRSDSSGLHPGFILRTAGGVDLHLTSRFRDKVFDEVRNRIRYIRCIVASARKIGWVERRDAYGKTALHLACEAKDVQEGTVRSESERARESC
jgi:hypothetical protein